MEEFILHLNIEMIYFITIGLLLLLSYSFIAKSGYDERRKRRFRVQSLYRYQDKVRNRMHKKEYDDYFRSNGLPAFITSERFNTVRFLFLGILIITVLFEMLFNTSLMSMTNLVVLGSIPVLMIPKKPSPFYYLVKMVQKRYNREKNNEIYQFYNEMKAEFRSKGDKVGNSYHIIMGLLPYYKYIRPALEKMLTLLEKTTVEEAWTLFKDEINNPEANSLSIVMQEIESTGVRQAGEILEQKRVEFANSMYNNYKEYLYRRKIVIFSLALFGTVVVIMNEVTVFFLWYKDVMSVVNNLGQ